LKPKATDDDKNHGTQHVGQLGRNERGNGTPLRQRSAGSVCEHQRL
jgi:hypothetical protein